MIANYQSKFTKKKSIHIISRSIFSSYLSYNWTSGSQYRQLVELLVLTIKSQKTVMQQLTTVLVMTKFSRQIND